MFANGVKFLDISALLGQHSISNIPRCIEGSQCANVVNNRLASKAPNTVWHKGLWPIWNISLVAINGFVSTFYLESICIKLWKLTSSPQESALIITTKHYTPNYQDCFCDSSLSSKDKQLHLQSRKQLCRLFLCSAGLEGSNVGIHESRLTFRHLWTNDIAVMAASPCLRKMRLLHVFCKCLQQNQTEERPGWYPMHHNTPVQTAVKQTKII